MKKQNNKTELVNSTLKKILDNKVDLEPKSPDLPLKDSSWGVIWFDEFYNEERYGDVTFIMSPTYFKVLLQKSIENSKCKDVSFSDGRTTYIKQNSSISIDELLVLENLDKPFYVHDDSGTWLIECHYEGSNYFASSDLMNGIIEELGGSKLIYEEMLESLKDYEVVREIAECEFKYLENVYFRLKSLEKVK